MTVYTLFLYIGIAAITLTAVLAVGPAKIKKHPVIHPFTWLVQYFVGSLLIFSGLVKGVDPLGTAYKMKDYFTEFEVQGLPFMDVMQEYVLPFSLVMLVLELVLGASLILGLGQRKTTWTTLLMMTRMVQGIRVLLLLLQLLQLESSSQSFNFSLLLLNQRSGGFRLRWNNHELPLLLLLNLVLKLRRS